MCGRFTLSTPGEILAEAFGLEEPPELAPRYNIAPTQPVVVFRRQRPGEPRRAASLRWGLLPSKVREPGRPLINARSEGAARLPSFREAFHHRRCLIPADGFYEWKVVPFQSKRQPMHLCRRDGRPFAFAGLWEPPSPEPGAAGSCTILTTEPNALIRPIHDRMPVILSPADFEAWLDPAHPDPEALEELLRPFPAEELKAYHVGPAVNDARYDGPDCRAPLFAAQ